MPVLLLPANGEKISYSCAIPVAPLKLPPQYSMVSIYWHCPDSRVPLNPVRFAIECTSPLLPAPPILVSYSTRVLWMLLPPPTRQQPVTKRRHSIFIKASHPPSPGAAKRSLSKEVVLWIRCLAINPVTMWLLRQPVSQPALDHHHAKWRGDKRAAGE